MSHLHFYTGILFVTRYNDAGQILIPERCVTWLCKHCFKVLDIRGRE